MGFAGYTLGLQRLFHLVLAQPRPVVDPAVHRSEALVVFRIYVAKLNLAFALGILLYMIVSRATSWHHGVLLISLCVFGGNLLALTYLQPRTLRMAAALTAELGYRQKLYRVHDRALDVTTNGASYGTALAVDPSRSRCLTYFVPVMSGILAANS